MGGKYKGKREIKSPSFFNQIVQPNYIKDNFDMYMLATD